MSELEQLVVLDLSKGLAGAYCAKLLADAGADVTLVEPPNGTDMRRWAWGRELRPEHDGDGALFRYLRHGHRSVTAVDADRARVAELAAASDMVLTDSPAILGSAAELAGEHRDLIVVSVTPFGLTGPDAERPGTEFTAQAEGGAIAVRGTPDRPPLQLSARVVEWLAGACAAAAALAAHRRQRTTGDGDLIDVSLCEVANMTGTLHTDLMYSLSGRPPLDPAKPARNVELPSIEPTADGWVGFNTNSRQQFESFCLLIERPDLITEGSWASLQTRVARAAEWNSMVREWTTRHTTAEITERAVELRVPVAPVCDGRSVTELDHVLARGVLVDAPSGDFRMPRRPWTINLAPEPPKQRAPAAGSHNDEPGPVRAPRPSPSGRHTPPLAGLRVVDLTAWWAGPSATGLFAALGADVIHVESTGRPDGMRMTGGMFADRGAWWEYSSIFLAANTNKRGLTLDLNRPRGRDLLLRLVEHADLVVENFTPRVLDAFGLGWDAIHAANPRAVMVRMPAFGLDGPWRDRPGFAQTMEQVTGLAWLTGHSDDQPRIQRGPCDPNGGMHAAFAALVALARRDRTGVGCQVEAPMFEAALAIAAEPVLEWTAYGNVVGRDGNRGPAAAPQGVYACAGVDRWLAVAAADSTQWQALCRVIGRPELAADPALASQDGRRRAHDRIDEAIGAWASTREVPDAAAALNAAGVPAAEAADPRLAHRRPQLVARGYFEAVDHPVVGMHGVPGLPWRATGVDRWIRTPAPTLGQHNRDVLCGLLGLSDEDLAALERDGIVGTRPRGL
ncbi:CoA transferase [Yinghuangia sp. YIM S09857]|uniref:CaiB/BaiF CoA-transferase family protein n=1 Tax=Yinghuangia sp. YIM S09857 TaxID=3436929 RepID=UPI003F53D5C0